MIVKIGIVGLVSAVGLSAIAWMHSAEVPASNATLKAQPPALIKTVASPPQEQSRPMLPPRMLDCRLGRITNFDPSRDQAPSEYKYDGDHPFRLFLPSIPVRTTEPPRSTQAPEPVDPQTRIVADRDGISAGAAGHPFDRVVDYWPERVELTTPLESGEVNLIILQQSEGRKGMTDIFMTKAKDAVTYDQAHLYSGRCKVTSGDRAMAAAG